MASKKQKIADKNRYSIITPNLDTCFICGTSHNICIHECFGGVANRPLSIEDGLCIPLCFEHHQGNNGVHFNKDLDLYMKQLAEKVWISKYTDKNLNEEVKIQAFIDRYGKNYLD